MVNLQKAGALAAWFEGLVYVIGFAAMATLLNPGNTEGWSALQKLAFVLERKALYQSWMIVMYTLFGVGMVVLTLALHERLKQGAQALMQIGSAFGLIWAGLVLASGMIASVGLETVARLYTKDAQQAVALWQAVSVVQNGLGGGVELVGGLWVLLLSLAAQRTAALPKGLIYLGYLVGIVGTLTVAPPLAELVALFGLSQIVWFIWIGVLMWRKAPNAAHMAQANLAMAANRA